MSKFYYLRKSVLGFTVLSGILFFSSFILPRDHTDQPRVLFENESVIITSVTERCPLPQDGTDNVNVLLSVKNKTAKKIAVTFQEEISYDGNCRTCGKDEYRYVIELDPHAVKAATCGDKSIFGLTIFHHMPSGFTNSKLTDFKLSEVTINQLD